MTASSESHVLACGSSWCACAYLGCIAASLTYAALFCQATRCNGGVAIDHSQSVYLGDAAGRPAGSLFVLLAVYATGMPGIV